MKLYKVTLLANEREELEAIAHKGSHQSHKVINALILFPACPGRAARHDYEYERCGVCNVFMASEPLAGTRMTKVTEYKKKWIGRNFSRRLRNVIKTHRKLHW